MPDEARRRRGRFLSAALAAGLCAALGICAPASAQPAPPRAQVCAACHGADGNSTLAGSPSLAGQPRLFIENQLVMIREGLRDVPVMKGVVDGMTDDEIQQLARFYASQPARTGTIAADAVKAQRGAALSQKTLCGTCHLPDYAGREQIPRLAQQREDYLLATMRQFRTGVYPGRDTIMSAALNGLSDADLADLAYYFATFGGGRP
jgi:cytochrome c553